MTRHDATTIATLAALALALAVAPASGAVTTTAGPSTQGQVGGGCDYVSLYDETIDSVVSVQSGAGLGSGFVFAANASENGSANATYVVTNAHVVGDRAVVEVEFTRGESARGTVVGRDRSTDLAVVRVPEAPAYPDALETVTERPRHGEPVAALGNPFGFEETITHGIVSGLNRSLPTQTGFRVPNTVQTDAPISPGNSGGPLVTCDGRVVGVNTAGIAAQGAENVGFAVSYSVVERVVPALVEDGAFEHPYLGVAVTEVTPAVAQANDLNETDGVIVLTTVDGAPADEVLQGPDRVGTVAGARVPVGSDVILSVEGTPVETAEDLASVLLTETRPGEEVTLTVLRDGERTTVTTELSERPAPEAA